jgi:hypothetical protein
VRNDKGDGLIETASAVRYYGKVEQGRTGPLRVQVETGAGNLVEVVLKASHHRNLTVEGLANEMMGSLLAGDLGLPTPRPLFVDLSKAFIATIPDADVRERLSAASPLAFGSTDAGSQWRRWGPTDRLGADDLDLALRVFAFDAFIGNSDRSSKNPNLLKRKSGGGMLLIDHETAFGFRMKLAPRVAPWVLGNLSHMAAPGADSEHLFHTALAGRRDLPLDIVRETWADLSDTRLGAYDALLPDAWHSARAPVQEALVLLRTVRDTLQECLIELQRVLQ